MGLLDRSALLSRLIDAPALAALDALERVGEPGWYSRLPLQVRALDAEIPQTLTCTAYLGGYERTHAAGIRRGPLPEYTAAHAELFLQGGPVFEPDRDQGTSQPPPRAL